MRKSMVYVDANPFIYGAIEEQGDEKSIQSRAILTKVATDKISAATSILTWDELVWVCRKNLTVALAVEIGRSFLSIPNLSLIEVDKPIAEKASALMTEYGLKPRDAIHAATAMLSGEKEIITDNSDFDRIKELKRITLAEAGK